MASDVNLEELARGTPGFSGADLANLVNEAALMAARRARRRSIGGRTGEEVALGEITWGAENDLKEATRLARRMVTE